MMRVNRFTKHLCDLSELTYFSIRKGRAILALLICFCTNAYVREEVLDEIQSERFRPQLVVHSLISPGDSIFVNVGRSIPLGDTVETSEVTDAVVTLSDEQGNTVEIPLVQTDYHTAVYGLSQEKFSIQAGHTYTLSARHPKLADIRAECTVPEKATSLISVEYVGNSNVSNESRYNVQVSWHDTNEYLHRVYFISEYQSVSVEDRTTLEKGISYYGHDPSHGIIQTGDFFIYNHDFVLNGVFYPDLYVSGDTVFTGEPIEVLLIHHLTTYLITPDKHMARYQESQEIFAHNRDALGSDSFIELYRGVIPEYSNIQGGLGVFGAYLRSEPVYLTLK